MLTNLRDKRLGIAWQIERRVIFLASCLKVGGNVVVWIAIAISAFHPHFLTPHVNAQRIKRGDLVRNAIDVWAALDFIVHGDLTP
jgi:hypothetical protein